MKDVLLSLITAVLIIAIVAGLVLLAVRGLDSLTIRSCETLSETSGYSTYHEGGTCWIELRPNLMVRRQDIHRYLKIIDPEKQ